VSEVSRLRVEAPWARPVRAAFPYVVDSRAAQPGHSESASPWGPARLLFNDPAAYAARQRVSRRD